ncbi:MAG TPA: ATP synthase F1 subunit gamma [Ignavibacteria bacterium]|nr:ATP synthase F1 subunit gamma [Ignavibacteria bacterium]
MATLKEIRNRVSAVKSIQKVTGSMKMVAAAKLRKAQEMMLSARPFSRKLEELSNHIFSLIENSDDVLLQKREIKSQLVVIITSDRGLAGVFNTNLIKLAEKLINESELDTQLVVIGKKAADFFTKHGYNIFDKYIGIFSRLTFDLSKEIVQKIVKGYIDGRYDSVKIVYNEFVSIIKQNPTIIDFLPFTQKAGENSNNNSNGVDFIYEPGLKEILSYLIPRQLNIQFWKALLESNAAEQGARMTAMETATSNATDLIKSLHLEYNRARQSAITTELLEIVGGAEALQKG